MLEFFLAPLFRELVVMILKSLDTEITQRSVNGVSSQQSGIK